MPKICVFGGTTEGRELLEYLSDMKLKVVCCVATEYAKKLLPERENIDILSGRKDRSMILSLLEEKDIEMLLDTTHPYATKVSEHLREACEEKGVEYIRLLREDHQSSYQAVSSMEEALACLEKTQGNILFTTGSKDLYQLKDHPSLLERAWVRILPMMESIRLCDEAGIAPSKIIAMQGPFSKEMNQALMSEHDIRYLVTKDGGVAGGFSEKMDASLEMDVLPLVIGRPREEEGYTLREILHLLEQRYGKVALKHVSIVGFGPAGSRHLTGEAKEAIERATCVIGARRMLEGIDSLKEKHVAISPKEVKELIGQSRHQRIVVLVSGDVGFFSGAKKLIAELSDVDLKVLPGISSLVYFSSLLNRSYENVHVISLHGRRGSVLAALRKHPSVFALVGGTDGMKKLCSELTHASYDVSMWIGERLGYDDELVHCGSPSEFVKKSFDDLSVALIERKEPTYSSVGLPDDLFIRQAEGAPVVPMTKSVIRTQVLKSLRLEPESICWDVGAGTGSVSVEMALEAYAGEVHAVEMQERAIQLLEKNKRSFFLENMVIHQGRAPEALRDLPSPTHVFIGGSKGTTEELIDEILNRNPQCRIVATAVSLEAISELTKVMKKYPWVSEEVLSLQVSQAEALGSYHMMKAQNPVTIFTFQGASDG